MKNGQINNHMYLKGKGVKYAVLVDKNDKLKVIPYNFDYLTFLLGGISYLLRKEFIKGIGLLAVQAILIFLIGIPFGVLANFLFTFVVAFFTGKDYVGKFIKAGAIAFEEYKENGYALEYKDGEEISRANEKKGKRMLEEYKKSIKNQNTIFYVGSIAIIIILFMLIGYKSKLSNENPVNNTVQTQYAEEDSNETINIPSKFVLLLSNGEDLQHFGIVDFNEKDKKINSKYYIGKVLVKEKDKSVPLDEIVKEKGYIPNWVFKKYFDIDGNIPQIKVDIKESESILPGLKDNNVENEFKEVLVNSSKLSDDKYDTFVRNLSLLQVNEDGTLDEKYVNYDTALKYKEITSNFNSKDSVKIEKGNYYELGVNTLASQEVLNELKGKIKENVIYYLSYGDVDYNEEVKLIKEKEKKNEAIKESKDNVTTEEDNNSSNSNSNSSNSYNQGGNNYYRPSRPNSSGSSSGSNGSSGGSNNSGSNSNGGANSNTGSNNKPSKPNDDKVEEDTGTPPDNQPGEGDNGDKENDNKSDSGDNN